MLMNPGETQKQSSWCALCSFERIDDLAPSLGCNASPDSSDTVLRFVRDPPLTGSTAHPTGHSPLLPGRGATSPSAVAGGRWPG